MLHWAASFLRLPTAAFFTPARRHLALWTGWLVGVLAFALYAYTAAPGIVTFFDDTLEFQTVAATFGIAHPTGYPLYTLLGGIWLRILPIGTLAGRLNLLSALFAALAVGLVAALASRLTTHQDGTPNRWAGVAAAISFALGPVWWSQATIAEVYALHGAFVAAILATAIGTNQSRQLERRMTALMLLFGLGLAHHRTTVLLAPPIALYLLWSVPDLWRPRRVWWQWLAALLAPLTLYLYIPLRAAAGVVDLNGSYRNSWAGFWNHVLALDYGAFFADNALARTLTPMQWLDLIRTQTGWLSLALALLGLAWLIGRGKPGQAAHLLVQPHLLMRGQPRRWRPARPWWLILGILVINVAFAILYRVPDPEVFLLPALLSLALFSGGGVGLLARWLPNLAATVLAALLLVMLVALPLGRGDIINRRHDWAAHDQARRMAQVAFPPQSQVIGLEGEMTALRYMQVAEQLGLNATPITANDPAQRRAVIAESMAQGLPVYLTREVEGIADLYSYSGDGALVRVWPRGQAQITLPVLGDLSADSLVPREQSEHLPPLLLDEGRVQIEAYTLRPVQGLAQPAVELTLYWRVVAPTDKTLKLSLRLLDDNGTLYEWPATDEEAARAAIEDRFPLHQVANIPSWLPGELVRDVHTLQLPPDLLKELTAGAAPQDGAPPGSQAKSPTLLVIIYDSATAMEEGRIEIMF